MKIRLTLYTPSPFPNAHAQDPCSLKLPAKPVCSMWTVTMTVVCWFVYSTFPHKPLEHNPILASKSSGDFTLSSNERCIFAWLLMCMVYVCDYCYQFQKPCLNRLLAYGHAYGMPANECSVGTNVTKHNCCFWQTLDSSLWSSVDIYCECRYEGK